MEVAISGVKSDHSGPDRMEDLDESHLSLLCHIDALPNEVLEYQIFNYFWFNHWVTTFTTVCKRWKQICEHSKMAPKHIVLSRNKEFDILKGIDIVTKYQPTILEIKCKPRSVPNFAFSKMISASKNLNTLILHHQAYMHPEYTAMELETGRFDLSEQITTLALRYEDLDRKDSYYADDFELSDADGFPSLKRLFVQSTSYEHSEKIDLEEIFREQTNRERSLAKYSPNGWRRLIPRNMIDKLSYERYFRYFGETKLCTALKMKDFAKAALLLDTQTSIDYEEYLHRYLSYQFPTSLKYDRELNVINEYENWLIHKDKCRKQAFELLIATNKLQVSASFKFLCFYQYGHIKDAIEVLKTVDPESVVDGLVQEAFVQMILLPEITIDILKHSNIIGVARRIVSECDWIAKKFLSEADQFEKIAFLRDDWSTVEALFEHEGLFWSMIRHGCRPPMLDLVKAEKGKDILTKLGYDFESVLFEELVKGSASVMSDLMEQHNVTPIFENKKGRSLFNALIRHGCDAFPIATYGQYADHIDSEGFTPLATAVSIAAVNVILDLFDEMEADPTIHRGDAVSPLVLPIVDYDGVYKDVDRIFNVMDLLLQYGADINAPCLFEQRMCSPLMIAVRKERPIQLIHYLIALGARVDYKDETGRSIVDYLISTYGPVEAALITGKAVNPK